MQHRVRFQKDVRYQVAQLNLAFLFLNRFLDICDAIEDDNTEIDNSDFLQTDLPSPYEVSCFNTSPSLDSN